MYSPSQPYLWDEQAAHAKLEAIVWPHGPVCPRCGSADRIDAVGGKGARTGLKVCRRCRKRFRATIGTLFERSHVPLHKWFQACFLLTASNNAISAHWLHLRLEVSSKTAADMRHRLEWAIDRGDYHEQGAVLGVGNWTETFGRRQPPQRGSIPSVWRSLGDAAAARRCADLPWTTISACSADQYSAPPTRQFLGFLEIAQTLGHPERADRFDDVLMRLGRCGRESSARSAARRISNPAFVSARLRALSDDYV